MDKIGHPIYELWSPQATEAYENPNLNFHSQDVNVLFSGGGLATDDGLMMDVRE